MCNTSRDSALGEGHLTLLHMLQLKAQHQSPPPPAHQGERLLLVYLREALPNLQRCHEGPRERLVCAALRRSGPSPITASLPGEVTLGNNTPSPKGREISALSTFQMPPHTLQPLPSCTQLHDGRPSSGARQGGTASSPLLHPSLNSFTLCTHSTLLTQPYLLLSALTFAHRYTHVPAPIHTALPIHGFTHTRFLNPAISALPGTAGFTD